MQKKSPPTYGPKPCLFWNVYNKASCICCNLYKCVKLLYSMPKNKDASGSRYVVIFIFNCFFSYYVRSQSNTNLYLNKKRVQVLHSEGFCDSRPAAGNIWGRVRLVSEGSARGAWGSALRAASRRGPRASPLHIGRANGHRDCPSRQLVVSYAPPRSVPLPSAVNHRRPPPA